MTDRPSGTRAIAEALLAPTGVEAFVDGAYGREAKHFAASDRARFAEYATLDALEHLMRAPRFFDTVSVALRSAGDLNARFAKASADVYDHLSRGGAVQFVGIEAALPDSHPLIQAFFALGETIGARHRNITVFLSQSGEAIPVHKDPVEIFTLQIAGSKTWRLFDFHPPSTPDEALDPDAAPSETVTLEPGDLFYLPKGRAHLVEGGEGLSISAALVFTPFTWRRLVEDLARAIGDDRAFWQALKPGREREDFEAMRAALRDALDTLDGDQFAARLAAERAESLRGLPANHLATALAVEGFASHTRLTLRPGLAPLVRVEGDHALLVSAHDDPIRAPIDAEAALRFVVAAREPFRIDDICPELSASSKLAIARKLARRGIVQLAPEQGG